MVKRAGKQFRRSLKTTDRQLATRRLAEFCSKVGRLSPGKGSSRLTFGELVDRWFASVRPNLKPASALRREVSINQLKRFFGDLMVRNIFPGELGAAVASLALAASLAAAENNLNRQWKLPEAREVALGGQWGEAYDRGVKRLGFRPARTSSRSTASPSRKFSPAPGTPGPRRLPTPSANGRSPTAPCT